MAPKAILINADTGAVLYEKNAHNQTYPASTTKIATALYSLQAKGNMLNSYVVATHESTAAVTPAARRSSGKHPSHRLEFGGSHMNLKLGEAVPFKTLLYGLMVCSGNDAANAISEFVSGSIPDFMKDVNDFLKRIGCKNTHFTNPHGLPDPLHVTTAYDLALMTSYAMKFPIFKEVVRTTRYVRPKTNKQEQTILVQSNALLKPGKFFYPYAIGVKTGYTAAAGSNLVAAAEKDGRRLIAVALNCDDAGQRYRSCITMFEAAFNEQKIERKLFSQNFDVFKREIPGAKTCLQADLKNDVVVEYYPSEEPKFDPSLYWNELVLPIKQGDIVGEIQITDQHHRLIRVEPIFARFTVAPTISHQVREHLSYIGSKMNDHKDLIGAAIGLLFILFAFALRPRRKRVRL